MLGRRAGAWCVAVGVGLALLLLSAAPAGAASCGWNPTCPYGQMVTPYQSTGNGLSGRLAVAVAPNGDTIVLASDQGTLRAYSPTGTVQWSTPLPDSLHSANSLAVDPQTGEIYVDGQPDCIEWFSADGQPQRQECLPQPSTSTAGTAGDPYFSQTDFLTAGPNQTLYMQISGFYLVGGIQQTEDVLLGLSSTGSVLSHRTVFPQYTRADVAFDSSGDMWLEEMSSGGTGVVGITGYRPDGSVIGTFPGMSGPMAISGSTLYLEGTTSGQDTISSYSLPSMTQLRTITVPGSALVWDGPFPGPMIPWFGVGPAGISAVASGDRIDTFALNGTAQASYGGRTPADFEALGAFETSAGALDVFDFANGGNDRLIQYPTLGSQPHVVANMQSTVWSQFEASGVDTVGVSPSGDFVVGGSVWPWSTPEEELLKVTPSGQSDGSTILPCWCGGWRFAANGDIYTGLSGGGVQKFAPDGTLLSSWSLPADGSPETIDPEGDIWSLESDGETLDEYSASGQPITSWRIGTQFEPAMTAAGRLAAGPDGNIYVAATDAIRVFSQTGTLLAVWPYPGGGWYPGPGIISVAPNGDVVLIYSHSSDPAGKVYVYTGITEPFPPAPPAADSPWAQSLGLGVYTVSLGDAIRAKLRCRPPRVHGSRHRRSTDHVRGLHCAGTATVSTPRRRAGIRVATAARHRRRVRLGRRHFSVRAHSHRRIRVRLNRHARRVLIRRHRVRVTVKFRYRAGRRWKTVRRHVVLRA